MFDCASYSTMSTSHSKSKRKTTTKSEKLNNPNVPTPVWGKLEQVQHEKAKDVKNPLAKQNIAQNRFKQIQIEHLQAAQKYTQAYESSSEEEDGLENEILESVFKNYGGDRNQLQKTQEFLENIFQSGASTCLICIGNVKRTDYVSKFLENTTINFHNVVEIYLLYLITDLVV